MINNINFNYSNLIYTMTNLFRMISLCIGFVCLIISCSPKKAMLIEEGTMYKRISLVVADIDRSLSIYRDVLGFTINNISVSDDDSYSYPVFKIPKEASIRFCTMDSPTQERALALTEVKGIDLPDKQQPHMSASVIRVKNIEMVMDKIKALNLETIKQKVATNSNGLMFKESAFVDYDGHLIVLYELVKSK